MKIIHLILDSKNHAKIGSICQTVHTLADYQVRSGYDVEVWVLANKHEEEDNTWAYAVKYFHTLSGKFNLDPTLITALEKASPKTCFHLHGAFIPEFYLVVKQLIKKDQRYVYTTYGAFEKTALQKNKLIKILYFNLFEKLILKNARLVHFIGQSEFEHIENIIKLTNKYLCPHGQDVDELAFHFSPIEKKVQPVFGFCGKFDIYDKGLDLLLQAFKQYKTRHGKGVLWLIGDGKDAKKLQEMVKTMELTADVTFLGRKYGAEKLNIISNMDVFCLPSRHESSPRAVIEAAALQVPCLVSSATNVGELVDQYNCGFHIREESFEKISLALHKSERMILNNSLKEKGVNGLRMVQNEFDWNKIAEKLANKCLK